MNRRNHGSAATLIDQSCTLWTYGEEAGPFVLELEWAGSIEASGNRLAQIENTILAAARFYTVTAVILNFSSCHLQEEAPPTDSPIDVIDLLSEFQSHGFSLAVTTEAGGEFRGFIVPPPTWRQRFDFLFSTDHLPTDPTYSIADSVEAALAEIA